MTSFSEVLLKFRTKANRRRPRHEEDDLQKACVRWFNLQYPSIAPLLHHSPNEGRLVGGEREGARRKARGVRAGFPDLIFLYPSRTYHGLAIELKTAKGRQSESQKTYQKLLQDNGYLYAVVRSFEQFQKTIIAYLSQQ